MRIYNTFSQKTENLDTRQKIGIYVCGITPYDTTHIGHSFTFIIYDVLVRYLKFLGAKATYVQNVTDIDDDILIKAKSVKTSWKKLGQKETTLHLKNMDALNFLRPDVYPKASDHITSMIRIIESLIDTGLAYEKNGNVYFSTQKEPDFGKLSRFSYSAMLEIANDRGNFPLDKNKQDPLDFILWQKSKEGEPSWRAPWSKGRPGWHIECSAMAMHYLGPTITIHGGGTDLIFPHHEAEIAQSENSTGKKFGEIWMHAAMVYCEGKKMSKSLGNMIFVADLLKKYSPNAIRLYLLSHHWREPFNYDENELKNMEKTERLLKNSSKIGGLTQEEVKKAIPGFFNAMEDDFNVPKAINELVDFAKSRKSREAVYTLTTKILGLNF